MGTRKTSLFRSTKAMILFVVIPVFLVPTTTPNPTAARRASWTMYIFFGLDDA